VSTGRIADLIVVDPGTVADTATYDAPLGDTIGIDDVVVGGRRVLADGALTESLPGRGIRRRPTEVAR
jgi:N-acyl-D-amino-acid deacylase